MFISDSDKISSAPVIIEGAKSVLKQSLVGPDEGWENHVMRLFTIKENGHTPKHSHPWPHINYVVSGEGIIFNNGKEYSVKTGGVAYIPQNSEHQFINTKEKDFVIICIVPIEGDK